MIKRIYFLILCFIATTFTGAVVNAQVFTNQSCASALPVCTKLVEQYNMTENMDGCTKSLFYYFYVNTPGSNQLSIASYDAGGSYVLYRLSGDEPLYESCNQLEQGNAVVVENGNFGANQNSDIGIYDQGLYIVRIKFNSCYYNEEYLSEPAHWIYFLILLEHYDNVTCEEPSVRTNFECKDCITSFSPTPGKYMVSAWVSEDGASINTTTYTNTSIGVSYSGDATTYTLTPSGQIIDGWQRIESVIEVPSGATDIHLTLQTSSGTSYFDDVRFSPLDGSMLSYVYDPINLRLMAQLDERNYATFYEYDEEGKLVRVKKETERGVMTIQENRDNIRKK